jgi:hypothetical protein
VFLNKKIKCSKDRILRVRCREANDLNSNKPSHEISGPMIRLTDTMIGISKLKNGILSAVIFTIVKLKLCNNQESFFQLDSLNECELIGKVLTFTKLDDEYLYWSRNYGDRVELNGQFCLQMPCDLVEIDEKEFTVFSMNKSNESLEIIRSMIDDYLFIDKVISNKELSALKKLVIYSKFNFHKL